MKYVVMKCDKADGSSIELPIIFPNALVHSDVADHMATIIISSFEKIKFTKVAPVSAGFLSSMDIVATCNGMSVSLKLESRGQEDNNLIKMMDYGSMHKC